jgi:SAM-dependent methyltransferase
MIDRSNGWEAVASQLIALRSPTIGVATLHEWVASLHVRGAVLELGCGAGIPVSEVLVKAGFDVYAIDAAPSLVAAFRHRFPGAQVACETVEDSPFFERTFDAAVAIGVLFLLPEQSQRDVVRRVAGVLRAGGRFLFTAPVQVGAWPDSLTGRQSVSLGIDGYKGVIDDAGLTLVGEYVDEGENHYYDTRKDSEHYPFDRQAPGR